MGDAFYTGLAALNVGRQMAEGGGLEPPDRFNTVTD